WLRLGILQPADHDEWGWPSLPLPDRPPVRPALKCEVSVVPPVKHDQDVRLPGMEHMQVEVYLMKGGVVGDGGVDDFRCSIRPGCVEQGAQMAGQFLSVRYAPAKGAGAAREDNPRPARWL